MRPLCYVILRHEGIPEPHFDLMFETAPGSALKTWRSPAWPIIKPTPLIALGDHRQSFLDYDGPLSNNRGHVRRIGRGHFIFVSKLEAEWKVVLDSSQGELSLTNDSGSWIGTPSV